MIEVLFSESEGISMRVAKNYSIPDFRRGHVGYDKSQRKPTIAQLKKEFAGKPVGGSKEDVVYIDMWLDIGNLNIPIDSEYRKNLLLNLQKVDAQDEYFDMEYFEDEWDRHLTQMSRLYDFMKQGESFRIWYSNTPYSLCGFYYVCSILKDSNCSISIIKFPESQIESEMSLPQHKSWRDISAGKMYQFLPLEKHLTDAEFQEYAKKWEALVEGESDLRAIVEGELKGVSADYYDDIIRKEIPDGQFRLGPLLGTLIESYPQGPPDSWYTKRIIKMIDDGELAIIKKDPEIFYSSILKKQEK